MKYYQVWAKKLVDGKEWNSWYIKNSSYCFLKNEGTGVWIGFLTGSTDSNYMPDGCYKPTDMELIQIDQQRRGQGVYPTPLKDIKVDKVKATPETLKILDKMKSDFKNKIGKIDEAPNMPTPLFKPLNPIQKDPKPISDEDLDVAEEEYADHITEEDKQILREIPF